jgi:hypothetical protein
VVKTYVAADVDVEVLGVVVVGDDDDEIDDGGVEVGDESGPVGPTVVSCDPLPPVVGGNTCTVSCGPPPSVWDGGAGDVCDADCVGDEVLVGVDVLLLWLGPLLWLFRLC